MREIPKFSKINQITSSLLTKSVTSFVLSWLVLPSLAIASSIGARARTGIPAVNRTRGVQAEDSGHVRRLEHLTGKTVSVSAKKTWDSIYSRSKFVYGKAPAKFLASNYRYLPRPSKSKDVHVLDMGTGEGRNAIFLAKLGYKVTGIDISKVAIEKARRFARDSNVSNLEFVNASLDTFHIPDKSFDVIICFYYVDRDLVPKMVRWLRPGGIIVFEAYTKQRVLSKKEKPVEAKFYLSKGELLSMFPGLRILKFEEPVYSGEFTSSVIAQKPALESVGVLREEDFYSENDKSLSRGLASPSVHRKH